ncbi:MAG: lysophospholipid acyltransferase family protein [Chitinophagales bacterium]
MKKIFFPLRVLWAWYYFFIFALVFILLYPLFAIFLSNEKWYGAANRLRVFWARVLFLLTGIFPSIRYTGHLDRSKNYIFCSNHFSYLDIPVSALVVKKNWRFMAKAELSDIPILNIFFRTVDISVDRESGRESFKAFQEAGESLENGMSIVNYPEGKISNHVPTLARFKNGPFRMAIEKKIPIVPLTMIDNWKLLFVDGWKMHGRPGISRVIVHPPIETKHLKPEDLDELKRKVFQIIEHDLVKFAVKQKPQ